MRPPRAQTGREAQKNCDAMRGQIDGWNPGGEAGAPGSGGAAAAGGRELLERKPGDGVTFFTRGGELSIYGNLDVSFDYATKGISRMTGAGGPTDVPAGNGGWMPDISSNLSYIGVPGFPTTGTNAFNLVYPPQTP